MPTHRLPATNWFARLLAVAFLLHGSMVFAAEQVSFQHDVMAVLSKAGCNMGTCHGNQNGKGGFRLSLRGQDPAADLDSLTRDQAGRRTDKLNPAQSLILLKPTMQVAHEGGRRFSMDSPEYATLLSWVTAGAKPNPTDLPPLVSLQVSPKEAVLDDPQRDLQLTVIARFADGTERDVTRTAVYETSNKLAAVTHDGLVQKAAFGATTVLARYLHLQVPARVTFVPPRPGFVWSEPAEQNYIDQHAFARLKRLRANPAPLASDEIFLRRVHLDLIGVLPTADEARAFLEDTDPDKRSKLIDRLLYRPEFADFWAMKWSDLLRNEEKVLDQKGVQNFHNWIRTAIDQGMPLDQFVRELIAARGSTYTSPAANYYRANRDPTARAEATAQLFLGLRLQCVRCHNHPFDHWTQADYYGWSALFTGVRYKILENRRRDDNDQHEFDGEQVVWLDRKLELPQTPLAVTPPAKFLGAAEPDPNADADRLEQLAAWVGSDENPYFARAQVNRIWFHLMGRGIVDPIDDFRATNPPVNPELLEALANDFIAHQFDLRHLIRTIANSRTYQSGSSGDYNETDDANFARALVRPLSAEQLLDAMAQTTGAETQFVGFPQGTRAMQLPGVATLSAQRRGPKPRAAERFLRQFGKPPRLLTCECERSDEITLGQTFQLISGPLIHEMLSDDNNRLTMLLASDQTDQQILSDLYLAALARQPTEAEINAQLQYVSNSQNRRQAWEDVTWSLLNAKEFLLRQ